MGFGQFLLVYLLGGISFLPLVALAIYAHAIWTCPVVVNEGNNNEKNNKKSEKADSQADEDGFEKSHQHQHHHHGHGGPSELSKKFTEASASETAAGYFAVTREFTPGGLHARPPERPSPVGGGVPTPEKPTIGQAVYRTIFENSSGNGSGESVNNGRKGGRRARNVFFVVLRHRCLMLYDDEEQNEVRFVIPLANYMPNIFDGEEDSVIPEGEIYIKRNAIRLSYRTAEARTYMEGMDTEPYYLFTEDCSLKEDFYFAMIAASEEAAEVSTCRPLPIDTKDLIALVQRLHASEDNMQTRWLNALLGRVFLGIYRTRYFESQMRMKIAKKISRVSKPGFLSDIELGRIDVGNGLPYITNPRLRELNVDGSFMMEADLSYGGGLAMEFSTVATIHLGARIRRREVNLVLSVRLKKIEGHCLFKIKPPPSNRVWVSFETLPKMELEIVPIVSSRQMTYSLIVRAIENRIREVFAETMVYPNFDDTPFFDTLGEECRGGIWEHMSATHEDTPIPVSVPLSSHPDELDGTHEQILSDGASVLTTSTGESSDKTDLESETPSRASTMESKSRSKSMSSSPPDSGAIFGKTPPKSFMPSAAVVSADAINVTASLDKNEKREQDAASAMRAIGSRSPEANSFSSSLRPPPKAAHRKPYGEGRGEITRRLTDVSDSDRKFLQSSNTLPNLGGPPLSPSDSTSSITHTDPAPKVAWNSHHHNHHGDESSKTQSPAIGALLNAGAATVKKWYKTRQTNGQQASGGNVPITTTTTISSPSGGTSAVPFTFPKTSGSQAVYTGPLQGSSTNPSLLNGFKAATEARPIPISTPSSGSNSSHTAPIAISSSTNNKTTSGGTGAGGSVKRRPNGSSRRHPSTSAPDLQEDLLIVAKPESPTIGVDGEGATTKKRSGTRRERKGGEEAGEVNGLGIGIEIDEDESRAWVLH